MLMRRKRSDRKKITLALQGGGAHGAFVWGVLDRLLADARLEITGISGTSSGAVNAALVADGLAAGGPEGARRSLNAFWKRIHAVCMDRKRARFALPRPGRKNDVEIRSARFFYDIAHRLMVPYYFDPMTMEPLRSVIAASIDFERLRTAPVKLFVNATDVRTTKMRVFASGEISVDALCASSCLPFLFHPVEVGGAHYWDGGFMGNPALYPLIYDCAASDIVLVQTSAIEKPAPPSGAAEILERMSEISFAATLVREIQMVAQLNELIARGGVKRRAGLRPVHMHVIESDAWMRGLPPISKFQADWDYLSRLRASGEAAAERWLAGHFDSIGAESTVDIEARFL